MLVVLSLRLKLNTMSSEEQAKFVQFYIPSEKRWKLEKTVDYDNGVDRDLRKIAETMHDPMGGRHGRSPGNDTA